VPTAATAIFDPAAPPMTEFRRQVDVLVSAGYPELLDRDEDGFRALLEPLADRLPAPVESPSADHLSFVIVVHAAPVPDAAARMTWHGKPAVLMLSAAELPQFTPIDGIDLPGGPAYLLTDVDTGSEFCAVRPADALPVITGRNRTPLTIAEGVFLVTTRPDMLRKNRCFSLLGSRRGDKRVPAIWISNGAPKLGWCWNGNPHTWLGSASAAGRTGGVGI
jgi:hypothetical protein